MRWVLSPLLVIFAVMMPLLIEEWTPAGVAIMVMMEFICVAARAGFWLPKGIREWGFRGCAGAVFLLYAAYLLNEWIFTDKPFRMAERRSEASPRNALLGFIIIGLPMAFQEMA